METISVVVTDDSELSETVMEIQGLSDSEITASGLNRLFDFPLEFFSIEAGPTAGTGKLGVRIKRADKLNVLLSAARARKAGHARSLSQ